MRELFDVVKEFDICSDPIKAAECTIGHINSTFFIYCADGTKYVLQKINTGIFKDPDILMDNIFGVTEHIRSKLITEGGDCERGTLNFIKTKTGMKYYTDSLGQCWRLYKKVVGVRSYQLPESNEMFEKVGTAFGRFQMQLADYDASALRETIPNFHNTPSRLRDLRSAISADNAGRAAEVANEIEFALSREEVCAYITDKIDSGAFPLRVTHNDTKLNNILMDEITDEPVCVIDLDTIMPGSVLFDFGDAIRTGASSAAEDETDLSSVYMKTDSFDAFSKGFIGAVGGSVTEAELSELPMGALILTLETGIRFLTDYLNGDTYFRIAYPEHNLDRARNQFKLVADMEAKLPLMREIIKKYI